MPSELCCSITKETCTAPHESSVGRVKAEGGPTRHFYELHKVSKKLENLVPMSDAVYDRDGNLKCLRADQVPADINLLAYDAGDSEFRDRSLPYKYVSRTSPPDGERLKLGFQPIDVHEFKAYWSLDSLSRSDHPTNFLRFDEGDSVGNGSCGVSLEVVRLDAHDDAVRNWSHKGFVADMHTLLHWREAFRRFGWLVYGMTRGGLCVVLEGNCEYTGFDVGGRLRFYVSKDPVKIWWQAFTDAQRREMEEAGIGLVEPVYNLF